jgi:hypothetical protein
MRITILNGNPDPANTAFDGYLQQLVEHWQGKHEVTQIDLRDLEIKYCIGCFGCWVKTPGECTVPDESPQVRRAVINSDFTLLASPMRMGFVSALMKKMNDKFIPLIHPYIVVDQGEAHHLARYDRYPLLGLLLENGSGNDDEDIQITTDIYRRTALNMKSRLLFARLTQEPVEEVADAINNL